MNINTCKKITDKEVLLEYQADESSAFIGKADALYLPKNEKELVDTIKNANKNKTVISISGGGTGITGARVPIHGGIVVSTKSIKQPTSACPKNFSKIIGDEGYAIYLNKNNKRAIVPASIPLITLDKILAKENLLYPPDPTEMSATIGGTVATNASGARSFFYGPTRNWIEGLRVIFTNGETTNIERGKIFANKNNLKIGNFQINLPNKNKYQMPKTKNVAGLFLETNMDAIDLFIGSEGMLGCFSDITIKLANRIPFTLTVIAFFDCTCDALAFVNSGITAKQPYEYLSFEYFDKGSLDLLKEKYQTIPNDISDAVLFEVPYDTNKNELLEPTNEILKSIDEELSKFNTKYNWAVSYNKREEMRLFRHALPEAINEFVKNHYGKISSDFAVPHNKIYEMFSAYKKVSVDSKLPYVIFGHLGNDHVHLNFLPENEDQFEKAKKAYIELAKIAIELGGTISAEHGVGKKYFIGSKGEIIPYLNLQFGKNGLTIIKKIKSVFDPNLILNFGNMFIGAVTKY
jgi:D-lactate dehydrogenase (cytochrome)